MPRYAKYSSKAILARYPNESISQIARSLNISYSTVRNVLHRNHAIVNHKGRKCKTGYDILKIKSDYQAGLGISALARKYNIPYSTMHGIVQRIRLSELEG